MSAQTPGGVEFSIAAKILVCADQVVPAGGAVGGHRSPSGKRVSFKKLVESMTLAQLDSLVTTGYAQIWEMQRKQLIGSFQTLGVRAVYSGAPGFGGTMLEATRWADTDFYELCIRLMGSVRQRTPYLAIVSGVEREFQGAGILHGDAWDPEWLAFLTTHYAREAWDAVQHLETLPWKETARRSLSMASGSLLETDDD